VSDVAKAPVPRRKSQTLPVYGAHKPSVNRRGGFQQGDVGARREPIGCQSAVAGCAEHTRPRAGRIAIVTDTGWIRAAVNAFGILVPEHVRVFDDAELDAAKW
jgi:hypothetical protein